MVPDKCEKCGHDRFRQDGEAFVCKECGHRNKAVKTSPTKGDAPPPKDDKK